MEANDGGVQSSISSMPDNEASTHLAGRGWNRDVLDKEGVCT